MLMKLKIQNEDLNRAHEIKIWNEDLNCAHEIKNSE